MHVSNHDRYRIREIIAPKDQDLTLWPWEYIKLIWRISVFGSIHRSFPDFDIDTSQHHPASRWSWPRDLGSQRGSAEFDFPSLPQRWPQPVGRNNEDDGLTSWLVLPLVLEESLGKRWHKMTLITMIGRSVSWWDCSNIPLLVTLVLGSTDRRTRAWILRLPS